VNVLKSVIFIYPKKILEKKKVKKNNFMCTISYYLRESKAIDGRSRGSICLRLIHRRKAKTIATGIRLHHDEWDAGCQSIFSLETRRAEYVFPIITDPIKSHRLQYENGLRAHNKTLKELAILCGINKPVSSHVARHSWATIAKYERLPLSVISESLGHNNEKTTYIYLASFEQSRLDEANELVGKAIERASAYSVPPTG